MDVTIAANSLFLQGMHDGPRGMRARLRAAALEQHAELCRQVAVLRAAGTADALQQIPTLQALANDCLLVAQHAGSAAPAGSVDTYLPPQTVQVLAAGGALHFPDGRLRPILFLSVHQGDVEHMEFTCADFPAPTDDNSTEYEFQAADCIVCVLYGQHCTVGVLSRSLDLMVSDKVDLQAGRSAVLIPPSVFGELWTPSCPSNYVDGSLW
jgi:hypothetical protein